jgi:hypothetical protein
VDDEPETPLSPAEEREVRRLLADARHTDPMPDEVAARLDRVLGDLAAEPGRRAPVTQLATRRRRVASLLVAAAAVVVVGIGIGQVVQTGAGEGDSASEAPAAGSADEGSQDGLAGGQSEGFDAGADAEPELGGLPQTGKLYRLRPAELSADLRRLQRTVASDGLVDADREPPAYRVAGKACESDAWGAGTFVLVRYGKVPAVLVLRRPLGDTQVAEVFLCGSTEPVRSLTLPAP